MLRQVVNSSSIRSIGYDASRSLLEVEFASDSVYQYENVPRELATAFLRADSKGGYFQQHVRDRFPTSRVR